MLRIWATTDLFTLSILDHVAHIIHITIYVTIITAYAQLYTKPVCQPLLDPESTV